MTAKRTILLTGATDGIGLATAKMLCSLGHKLLIHGRNPKKLADVEKSLAALEAEGSIHSYVADLSRMSEVEALAQAVIDEHDHIDVLINNAGIFRAGESTTSDGLDIRFAVNTLAPYLLTKRLLPILGKSTRVVNLSSAAQATVDLNVLAGKKTLSDEFALYAQSKLAITMWSRHLALSLDGEGPVIVAVNPGSMLGSKMVKEGFGVAGGDIQVGAKILTRAALDDAFSDASGKYFDNDSGQFASPHIDAMDAQKCETLVESLEDVLSSIN